MRFRINENNKIKHCTRATRNPDRLIDLSLIHNYSHQFLDPRTNHWPLISSPVPGVTILAAYLYFVVSWGPRYMANRKPLQLERTLIVYNFIQVIVSTYIFYEVIVTHYTSSNDLFGMIMFCCHFWYCFWWKIQLVML